MVRRLRWNQGKGGPSGAAARWPRLSCAGSWRIKPFLVSRRPDGPECCWPNFLWNDLRCRCCDTTSVGAVRGWPCLGPRGRHSGGAADRGGEPRVRRMTPANPGLLTASCSNPQPVSFSFVADFLRSLTGPESIFLDKKTFILEGSRNLPQMNIKI